MSKKKQKVSLTHLNFLLASLIDSKVYLHRPGQFLDLSGRMGYKVFLGDQIQSQINYQDVRMVPKTLDSDGSQSCSMEVFDECIYTKVTRLMYEKAPGCTVPWVMNNSV